MRAALALSLAAALAACGSEKGAPPAPAAADAALAARVVDAAAPAPPGCPGVILLPSPADPAATGPWPVGVRTATLAGLRAEIWYPARPGSEAGVTPAAYDLAEVLPVAEAARLRARGVTLPPVPCRCFRDLPIDDAHGPYPLVLYVHGLTLFRFASVTLTAHLASRGFVVVAADFPGATLESVLAGGPRASATASAADATRLLDSVPALFPGRVDVARVGLTGHSFGGQVVSVLAAARGEVAVTLAERGVVPAPGRSFLTVVVGGSEDRVEPYARQVEGFAASPEPKRFVGVPGAGHMSFTDVCAVAPERGGLLAVAHASGVRMRGFLARLADRGCEGASITPAEAWPPVLAATASALEEVLHCRAARASTR